MVNNKILIEENVPLIGVSPGRSPMYPFEGMKVGDSFEVDGYSKTKMQSIYGSIYNYKAKKGNSKKQFACRKTEDAKMRVWRTN